MSKRSIFITGGGSGIGRAIAQKFAREGWFVGISDINPDGLRETAALLDGACFTHQFDVRDRAAWDTALAEMAAAAGGKIHVLANNAGIPLGGSLILNSEDEITRCLDINLKGVLFGAQAAYPFLKASAPDSCLLNTASAAGIYGTPGASTYSATKFGVRGLTECLDGEWASDGIKVRSLCPGFIDTPLLDHNSNAQSNQAIRERVKEAGLEISPVSDVAEAAWAAIHSEKVHHLVGKTARRLNFAVRWTPGWLRKSTRNSYKPLGA